MFKFNERLGETRGPAGGDKKGNPFKKYIPVEEIADTVPNMEESEENEVLSEEEDFSELEFSSIDDMQEKEKRNKGNMSREIGFEEGEGVAHIGPDVSKNEQENNDETGEHYRHIEEKFRFQKKGVKPLRNNNIPVTTRQIEENKKPKGFRQGPEGGIKRAITGAYPKDNLKTIKKMKNKFGETSKLQRILRKKMGKFYNKQTGDEKPSWEDILDDQKN